MSPRTISIMILIGVTIVMATIGYGMYINRNREHIPTAEETAIQDCIKRGGNPTSKVGWDNEIYIQEYKCEGVK